MCGERTLGKRIIPRVDAPDAVPTPHRASAVGMPLLALPDDALAHVLGHCSVDDLRALACCSSATAHECRPELWYSMSRIHEVSLPRPGTSHGLRSKANLRWTFFNALAAQQRQRAVLADKVVWGLWLRLHKSDAAAAVARELERHPWLDPSHALRFYSGANLLHLAARRGRLRTVRALCEEHGVALDAEDEGGFTALTYAAWSGREAVAKFLVGCGADASVRGHPPTTSACGGRGRKTAAEWARRKGFDAIADMIESATIA